MSVILLCGGFGKRLYHFTKENPKPLISIFNTCLLLESIKRGIDIDETHFYICIGYKAEKFHSYFASFLSKKNESYYFGTINKRKIHIFLDELPPKTGTHDRIKSVVNRFEIDDDLYISYGDIFCDLSWSTLKSNLSVDTEMSILGVPNRSQYGVMTLDYSNNVVKFQEKPLYEFEWINGGVFFLKKSCISKIIIFSGTSFEREFLTVFVRDNMVKVYKYLGKWIAMDTFKDYENVVKEIEKSNEDINYRY